MFARCLSLLWLVGLVRNGALVDESAGVESEVRTKLMSRMEQQTRYLLERSRQKDSGLTWPMAMDTSCEVISTKDDGTGREIKRAAKRGTFDNGDQCGKNMFSESHKKHRRNVPANDLDANVDFSQLLSELEADGKFQQLRLERNEIRAELDALAGRNDRNLQTIIESRIVGGSEAPDGKYPWMVAIGGVGEGLRCGGTLVNSRWVVTAGHCFDKSEMPCKFNVRLGTTDWFGGTSGSPVDVTPELIVVHKDFDRGALTNDIALVKLSRDVSLSADSYVNSACLKSAAAAGLTKGGQDKSYMAAGWGLLDEHDSQLPRTLHEVALPSLPVKDCNYPITDKQLCAGSKDGGIDTCQGDSGGPLTLYKNDKWFLVGVTSYGNGCARQNWPGIYTRAPSYVDYIQSVISRYS